MKELMTRIRKISNQPDLNLYYYPHVFRAGYESDKDMCTSVLIFSSMAIIIALVRLYRRRDVAANQRNSHSQSKRRFRHFHYLALAAEHQLTGSAVHPFCLNRSLFYRKPVAGRIYLPVTVKYMDIFGRSCFNFYRYPSHCTFKKPTRHPCTTGRNLEK